MERLFVPLQKKTRPFFNPASPVQDVFSGVLSPEERAFFRERDCQNIGRWAEDKAAAFLAEQGLKILGRNVRERFSELDIVCKDGRELAVIEVRCRRKNSLMSSLDTIGPLKWRSLTRGAELFVMRTGWTGAWRIDLIAFDVDCEKWSLHWHKYLEMDGGLDLNGR